MFVNLESVFTTIYLSEYDLLSLNDNYDITIYSCPVCLEFVKFELTCGYIVVDYDVTRL